MEQTSENVAFAFNKEIIKDLLQDSLKYEGIVCSDWGVINDMRVLGYKLVGAKDHGVEDLTPEQKYQKAIEAGIDQFGGESDPETIVKAVQSGKVSEERINHSVRKLLKLKFQLGLFDNPYVDVEKARQICGSTDFMEKGKEAMKKSMVLLTNKAINGKSTLPASKQLKLYIKSIDKKIATQYGEVVSKPEEADLAILSIDTPYEPISKDGDFLENLFHQGSLAFKEKDLQPLLDVMEKVPTVTSIYLERPAVIPEIADKSAALIGHSF